MEMSYQESEADTHKHTEIITYSGPSILSESTNNEKTWNLSIQYDALQ